VSRRHGAALALAALLAACDNGRKDGAAAGPSAHVVFNGRKVEVSLVLTEMDRRTAPARFTAVSEEKGYLMAWPRPRFMKLESWAAQASFDVVFLDPAGKVVDHRPLPQGDAEGIRPGAEAAFALVAAPGLPKRADLKIGDAVELSPEVRAARPEELPVLRIGPVTAYIEVARTQAERQHGLMFRPRMSADEGMLFVYSEEGYRNFWMKNTLIPLDLAFFRADGTLVNVNETPTYPNPRVPPDPYPTSDSDEPARFVLEMNLGWFKGKGLLDASGRPKPGTGAELPPEATRGFGN
jgi:uncharacterized membrane protein (UPF0127 family)